MASFPRDQFDDIPDDLVRVGAHRATAKKGRGWLNLLWAILAVAVLILVGLFALSRLDPTNFPLPIFNQQTPTPTPTPTPTATPVTDPKTVPAAIMKTESGLRRTRARELIREICTQSVAWVAQTLSPPTVRSWDVKSRLRTLAANLPRPDGV